MMAWKPKNGYNELEFEEKAARRVFFGRPAEG
jgi:hypothetical protein